MSVFYEGQFTEQYVIDDLTRFYYIWQDAYTQIATFSQTPDDFRIEGALSDRIEIGSVGWWGGGVSWNEPTDLSMWTHLHLCASSNDASVADFDVLMGSSDGEGRVSMSDHGFLNDGAWHCADIPLADFGSVDVTAVVTPFALVADSGVEGDSVFIDDVYLTVVTP